MGGQRVSNGKKKGRGNTKNGNKYLAWAYIEAANFAVHYNRQIKRFTANSTGSWARHEERRSRS
ncbi:MAG: hypothetical protein P8Y27_12520 [Chromatiaceae bacterium]